MTAKARRPREHTCPPWCHPCPDIDGEILPICYGCAQGGAGLDGCTCRRRSTWVTKIKEAEAAAARAHTAVIEMADSLRSVRSDLERLESYARRRWGVLPWDVPVKDNVAPFTPRPVDPPREEG